MNSVSDAVTVRHLDTLESRYGCGAFREAYILDIYITKPYASFLLNNYDSVLSLGGCILRGINSAR